MVGLLHHAWKQNVLGDPGKYWHFHLLLLIIYYWELMMQQALYFRLLMWWANQTWILSLWENWPQNKCDMFDYCHVFICEQKFWILLLCGKTLTHLLSVCFPVSSLCRVEAWSSELNLTTLAFPVPAEMLGIQPQARDEMSDDIWDYCLESWEFGLPYREGRVLSGMNFRGPCGESRNSTLP